MSMLVRVKQSAGATVDYLSALSRSRTFWSGMAACAGFWTVAWFAPFLPLYAGTSIILLIVSIGVLLRYLPGFLEALVAGKLNDGEQLVLGVWVAWTGDIMLRTWAMSQRALGQPVWMMTSDIVTFIIFIKLLGATLHLTSPGTMEGRVPKENWVWIAIGVVIGALLTAAVLAMSIGAGMFANV